MKKINVLFHSPYSHIKMGGQISLVKLIENMDKSNFTLFLIVSEEGDLSKLMRENGYKVFIFGIPGFKLNNYLKLKEKKREFQNIIKSNDIDVIHSDNDKFSFFAAQWTKKLNVKVIFHARVTNKRPYDKLVEKKVDKIVGISEAVLDRFNNTKYNSKLCVIFNGVDCEDFIPAENKLDMKRQLGLDLSIKTIIYVGRIEERKGTYDLLKAVKILVDSGVSDFRLLLIGEEPPENPIDEISSKVKKLLLNDYVKKVGQKEKVIEWIQAADLLVLPSHSEGMGRVILEAMACGTTVIGTRIGGIKEAITDDVGLLVPSESPEELAKAINDLIKDDDLRFKMSVSARKRALELFDIKVHAKKMMELFEEIVEKSK